MIERCAKRLVTMLLVLSAILSACNTAPPPSPTDTPPSTATYTPPPTSTHTPTPTPTFTHTPTPTHTSTPRPTRTPRPTNTPRPTATDTPPPTATPTRRPTATPGAIEPTAPPPASAPSSKVVATFLADARQTQNDLVGVKTWFDRLAGGETVLCSTIYAHSIHLPVSAEPGQVTDLVPIWNEYQSAIADGQLCLQWLVNFCDAGGGFIDEGTFWDRRALSSSALSHAEHVVQALEAIP